MCSALLHRRREGFLLLEVLLGIGILGSFLGGIGMTLLLGQEHTIMGGDRTHAIRRTEGALEAARAIRDDAFSDLLDWADGLPHGVTIGGEGTWTLVPDPVSDPQGFRTALTILPVGDGHVTVRAETAWKRGYNRAGEVVLMTELTDWRAPPSMGDWGTVVVQGSGSIAGVTPMFTAAALQGEFLFVTSADEDGLYVIDLSSLSDPQLATSLDLGASGLDLAIRGDRLYVLTDDALAQLQVYDISDFPETPLGSPVSFDLQSNGRGRSIAFWGDRLLVGAIASADPGVDELFRIDVSTDPPVVLDSLNIDDADILGIAVSGTSALLATSDLGGEFQVADVRSASMTLTTEGYNAAGDVPGRSMAAAHNRAVLGRSGPHGLTRLDLTDQGFVLPASAPPTHDVGGTVNGLDLDARACVAFTAVGNAASGVDFQAVKLSGGMTSLGFLNKDDGDGRAVVYDADRDRVYLLTDDAWYVLRPGPGTLSCP